MGCSSGTSGGSCPPIHAASAQRQHCSALQWAQVPNLQGRAWTDACLLPRPPTSKDPGISFFPYLCPAVGMGPAPWDTPAPWAPSMALAVCGWLQQRLLWLQSKGPVELGSAWQGTGTAQLRCTDRLWAVRAALGTQPCPVTRTSPGGRTGLGGQDV